MQLTREEIEERLEAGIVGKVVVFTTISNKQIAGKVDRLAVWPENDELMVIFNISSERYECDLRYFVENTEIQYGNTYTGDRRDIRRVLKGD